jgi:hypothetical protein
MELKYLALGICLGYLAPYAFAFLKTKKEQASSADQETIFDYENDD